MTYLTYNTKYSIYKMRYLLIGYINRALYINYIDCLLIAYSLLAYSLFPIGLLPIAYSLYAKGAQAGIPTLRPFPFSCFRHAPFEKGVFLSFVVNILSTFSQYWSILINISDNIGSYLYTLLINTSFYILNI